MFHTIKLELPDDVPYAADGIKGLISSQIWEYHYGKHHKAYVDKALGLIKDTEYEGKSLIDIIRTSAEKPSDAGLFNNAAQVWNHSFYWYSMSYSSQNLQEIDDNLHDLIISSFESIANFNDLFKAAGMAQFGSGWVWLVYCNSSKKLLIKKTANAHTPITDEQLIPLLTMDVWEHAYYLEHLNRRDLYIDSFLKHINWQYASDNLRYNLKNS